MEDKNRGKRSGCRVLCAAGYGALQVLWRDGQVFPKVDAAIDCCYGHRCGRDLGWHLSMVLPSNRFYCLGDWDDYDLQQEDYCYMYCLW